MASIRTLLDRALIDKAGKSHNCQRNAAHRIQMGSARLKVRNGRAWDHYCLACGGLIIERDIEKLKILAKELEASSAPVAGG